MINNYNSLRCGMDTKLKNGIVDSVGSPPTSKASSARYSWLVSIMLLFCFFLTGYSSFAQTLISSTGNGGFESAIPTGTSTTDYLANGWTVVNNATAGTDKLFIGTAATASAGTYSAFSGTSASSFVGQSPASVNHFYQDVTFPAGMTKITLTFKFKIPTADATFDFLKLWLVPTTTTPVAGTQLASGQIGVTAGYDTGSVYAIQTVVIPASAAGTTQRLVFSWRTDGASPAAVISIDEIALVASLPGTISSTAIGGLWSSPATWVGGIVPNSDNVTIATGAIVTVDQIVSQNSLTVNGTLQWNATANAMTIGGNLVVNSGGKFLAYTTSAAGITANIAGNFQNDGFANLTNSTLNFNGSGSTLSGTGTFVGDGTRGIIRSLVFNNAGSNSVSTTQALTVNGGFTQTAGSLATGGLLKIDNTAMSYGQPLNLQVASVAVTTMGSLYTVAPVVFGAAVTQWSNITGVANTLYVSGGNVYRCTAVANIGPSAPIHISGLAQNLLWIGTTGTLGNPFQFNTSVSLGTQVFYGNNLYVCTAAGIPSSLAPPTHTGGTSAVSGAATFKHIGSPAMVTVNYDGTTQTVRSLNLTSGGSGYSGAPTTVFSVGVLAGTGSGAAATPVFIQSITGLSTGVTFQKSGGSATISGGLTINSDQGTSLATANPQASTGVGNVFTTGGGVNYTVAPTVGFSGPTALNLITNPGSGYAVAPTVTVTGGTLVSGTALTTSNFAITVNGGIVESVYLTGTATYSVPPTLALTASPGVTATLAFPAGCWPTATANIGTNAQLTSFTVSNPGFGYVAAPTVAIGTVTPSALGGTFTTVATQPTARIALYNLTLSNFTPSPAPVANGDDAAIPTNRKLNTLTLASFSAGLNLTSSLTLYGSSPLSLTGAANGAIIDLGGTNLNCTFSTFTGAFSSFGATPTYVKNGSISLTRRGDSGTLNFPFAGQFTWVSGSTLTPVTAGSNTTRVTVNETAAPTNASVGTGLAIGNKAYRVQLNGTTGLNPSVTLAFNSQDALTGTQDQLFVSEATALSGAWTTRSSAFGASGALPATGTKGTATLAPGPIAPTLDSYYAWSAAAHTITSVNNLIVCANSGAFTITGTNFTGATAVTIGGTAVSSFTVVSATQIDCIAGSGTDGVVAVTKNGATVLGVQPITVTASPSAPSVSPTSASINLGGTVNITATGTGGTLNWYNAAVGGAPIFTGANFNQGVCAGNIWVSENNGSCDGARTMVPITIAPTVMASLPATFCGTGGATTLSVTPSDASITYTWTALTGTATITSSNIGESITATVTETSNFQVVATTAGGCSVTSFISVGVYPLPNATVTTSANGVCPGTSATINSGLSAGNFSVASIPYAATTAPVTAGVLLTNGAFTTPLSGGTGDDGGWSGIPIGFPFNYFGTSFTTISAGTNGLLMFGAVPGFGTTSGQLGQFTFNGPTFFPNATNPGNIIALMAADLRPDSSTTGSIKYWTEGYAPNRTFVIEYVNILHHVAVPKTTVQCRLYETLGNVEIHILEKSFTNAAIVGLQDATKTIGAVAPGRAGGAWTVLNTAPEGWRFSPPANFTTTWQANGVNIPGEVAQSNHFSLSVTPLATTTYSISYTNTTTGCTNTPGSASVVMNVLSGTAPTTAALSSVAAVCSGGTANLSLDYAGITTGLTYQWQVSTNGGASYTNIAAATNATATVSQIVTSSYKCIVTSSCNVLPVESSAVTVTTPVAIALSAAPASVCSGGTSSLVTLTAGSGIYDTYVWSPATGVTGDEVAGWTFNPAATTAYTLTATQTSGLLCSSTASVTITIESPNVSATTSAAYLCSGAGTSATLTAQSLIGGPATMPGVYCTADSSGGGGSNPIASVVFGTINNSAAQVAPFSILYPASGATTTNVTPGQTYPLTVTSGTASIASVWIDFNRNGVYDASEWTQLWTSATSGTVNILIPLTATPGRTGMRIRTRGAGNTNTNTDACTAFFSGTSEDYPITIQSDNTANYTYSWSAGGPSIGTGTTFVASPTATTTYTVTATSAALCVATSTVTVDVSPAVTPISGGASSVCLGDPTVIDFDSEDGIATWSSSNPLVATIDGNGILTPLTTGTIIINSSKALGVPYNCTSFAVNPVTVNIYSPVVITNQPDPQSVSSVNLPTTATFSVVATGSVSGYQWKSSPDDITYTNVTNVPGSFAGATTASLTVTSAPEGEVYYKCYVSGFAPCTTPILSDAALLTSAPLSIETQPSMAPICTPGVTTGSATLTVVLSDVPDAVEWSISTDGVSFTAITAANTPALGLTFSGFDATLATSNSLTIAGLTGINNGWKVKVQAAAGATVVTSNTVTLSVKVPVTVPTVANKTVCYSGGTSTFVATTPNATSYAWEYSTDNISFASVANGTPVGATYANATTASLSVATTNATPSGGTYYYRAVVGSPSPCDAVNSNGAQLFITDPSVSVSGDAAFYCTPGGTAVNLTASGTATSYSWSPAAGLSATTGASVVATPSVTTTYTVTGTLLGCTKTAQVTVTVGAAIVATATATPAIICPGNTVQLLATTTGYDASAAGYSFSATAGTYAPLSGGTASTASTNPTGDDGTETSLPIGFSFVHGGTPFTTFGISTNGTIQLGATATSFTNSLATNANVIAPMWDDNHQATGSITYLTSGVSPNQVLTVEWSNIAIGGSGNAANPTNTFQLQLFEGTNVVKFSYDTLNTLNGVSASIGISSAVGKFRSVTPLSPVTSSTSSSAAEAGVSSIVNIPSGTTYTFTPPAALSYAWTSTPAGFTSTLANPTVTPGADTSYSVVVSSTVGCSGSAATGVTIISGVTPAIPTATVALASVCPGTTATFNVVATGPSLAYQWRKGGVNIDGIANTSALTATLTLTGTTAASAGSYDVVITPLCGSVATSTAVSLAVLPLPTVTAPSNQNYCVGVTTGAIALSGSPVGVTYAISGGAALGLSNVSGVTAIPSFIASAGSATITITPSANGCTGTAATYSITVNGLPTPVIIAPATATICSNGTPVLLTASGGSTAGTYCVPTVSNSGATDDNITNFTFAGINNTTGDGPGDYNYYPTPSAVVVAGAATPFSITPNAAFGQQFRVWIDMNQNGVFEATESVFNTTASSTTTVAGNITVPTTALNGTTRMRVEDRFSSITTTGDVCALSGFGEFEDYNVTISGGVNPVAPIWTSTNGGLFTDAAGLVAYTGLPSTTVYARPTLTSSVTYTVTNSSGCTNAGTAVITVNPAPTLSSVAQAAAVCPGTLATINLSGLVAGTTSSVTYSIAGGASTTVAGVVASGTGTGSFTVLVTTPNNGQVLTVSRIVNDVTACLVAFSSNNTVTLAVTSESPFYADVDLDGYGAGPVVLLCASGSTVGYSVNNTDCDDNNAQVNPNHVEVAGNSIDDNCSGAADEVGPTVKLITSQCGITLTLLSNSLFCNTNALATAYRFEVSDGVAFVRSYDSAINRFNLLNIPGALYATTYSVRVSMKIGGYWQVYGMPCSITTPAGPPTTNVIPSQCGMTITNFWSSIFVNQVTEATGYLIELTDAVNGVRTYAIPNGGNRFNLRNFVGGAVANTVYTVRVAIRYNGVYQGFGAPCNITTSAGAVRESEAINTNVFAVNAYPNPFAENFKLDINTTSADRVEVKVYDMIGKLIEVRDVNVSELTTQEVGDRYPSGVYNVIVTQGANVKTLRVIKR